VTSTSSNQTFSVRRLFRRFRYEANLLLADQEQQQNQRFAELPFKEFAGAVSIRQARRIG
jgi:hypothetical protein